MRKTSITTYNEIKKSGLLSNMRFYVYDLIYHNGPVTQSEASKTLSHIGIREHSVTPRFAELQKMGVISPVGERKCSRTGRQAIAWDVTGKLPTKLKKEKKIHLCANCKAVIGG